MLHVNSFSPDVWEAICTPMHEILPRGAKGSGSGALFLGSWTASVDTDLLARNNINSIVEAHDSPWGFQDPGLQPNPTPPAFTRSPTSPMTSFQHSPAGSNGSSGRPPLARASSTVSGSAGSGAGKRKEGEIVRYRVSVSDSSTPDLLKPHLEGAVRFIDERLSKGDNVLVHCQQGISRSSAITIAFLMRCFDMSYDAALAAVKTKRKCIKPNAGFEHTLRESWGKR